MHVHAYTLHVCRYTTDIFLAHKALAKMYFLTHTVHVTLTVLSTSFSFFWERFLNGEQRKRRVSCMTKNTSAFDTAGLRRRRDSRSRREGMDDIWTTYILDLRWCCLKSLAPEMQVNAHGTSVQNLRHLGGNKIGDLLKQNEMITDKGGFKHNWSFVLLCYNHYCSFLNHIISQLVTCKFISGHKWFPGNFQEFEAIHYWAKPHQTHIKCHIFF